MTEQGRTPFPRFRRLATLSVVAGITAGGAGSIHAGSQPGLHFELHRLTRTGDPAPGGTTFLSLGQIALDEQGNFAFGAIVADSHANSIYVGQVDNPGGMQRRYSQDTTVPDYFDGAFEFIQFSVVSISDGAVAFRGMASGAGGLHQGVYSDITGELEKIADKLTAIPEGTGNFTAFSQPWIRDGAIVFRGTGSDGQDGIYKYENGVLGVIADTDTPMPGGPGNFASFGDIQASPGLVTLFGVPAFDRGITVFQGTDGNGHAGVYMEQGGVISVVADTSTAIPGGVGVFTGFDSSVQGANTRAGMVSFLGDGSNDQQGVYTYVAGVLAPAIDTNTFVPGAGMVSSIGTQSYGFDGGFVASLGQADAQGIFTTLGGSPRVVIKNGDLIYGRAVSGLGTYGQSLQGNIVGFNVGSYGTGSDQNAIFLARLVLGVDIAVTPARINLNNSGRVSVTVLANADFDAPVETAIPLLRFGRTGTEASLESCRPDAADVNGDSLPDLVCHFSVEAAGFQVGDTEAFLTGETVDGVSLEGSYPIRIVGK